jgi:sugar/nucleoside kinase (ribokinase family)
MLRSSGVAYEAYRESTIPDELVRDVLHTLDGLGDQVDQLGGSAFNVARSIRTLDASVRLGFVGIAGTVAEHAPHLSYLHANNIENSAVQRSAAPPATSISFVSDGDRTILTSIGCNSGFPDLLRQRATELSIYLAGFSVVHVTSLLDKWSAGHIAKILHAARQTNPALVVSLDPGTAWVKRLDEDTRQLFEQADILHLNSDEFDIVTGRLNTEAAQTAAGRVLALMPQLAIVVARAHAGAIAYTLADGHARAVAAANNQVVPNERVIDSTGAGDAFVAGFLCSRYSTWLDLGLELSFASAVARRKVARRGPVTSDDCETVLGEYGLSETSPGLSPHTPPAGR